MNRCQGNLRRTKLLNHVLLNMQVLAEYVWMGGSGTDLRSRTKVLDARPSCPEDCPVISVDGSLCGQGTESACEVFLKPRKIFRDPFRKGDHLIVLCDTFQLTEVGLPEHLASLMHPVQAQRPRRTARHHFHIGHIIQHFSRMSCSVRRESPFDSVYCMKYSTLPTQEWSLQLLYCRSSGHQGLKGPLQSAGCL
jgi:hypothetical protein